MEKLTMLLSLLCLTAAPGCSRQRVGIRHRRPLVTPEYGKPTSVEPVVTADRGSFPMWDVSKNTALFPPALAAPPPTPRIPALR